LRFSRLAPTLNSESGGALGAQYFCHMQGAMKDEWANAVERVMQVCLYAAIAHIAIKGWLMTEKAKFHTRT